MIDKKFTYQFNMPNASQAIIKVLGVGGGGSNAVNHMFHQGIQGVDFAVCNTDVQALNTSPVEERLQIGPTLTDGLGAGSDPKVGKEAAMESKEGIRNLLTDNIRMLFVTAGFGGGTGTGAAPEIAKISKEMGILTVGIVTMPFHFEGARKMDKAQDGLREFKQVCDTVIVILNEKLQEVYGEFSLPEAFAKADNILTTAARGIAEIITLPGNVNVDFEDVKTVVQDAGDAVMGSAEASGERRALEAVERAVHSPLINNEHMQGADKILISITSGSEQAHQIKMDEVSSITDYVRGKIGEGAEVIFGHGCDDTLGESIRVTLIATGFAHASHAGEPSKRRLFTSEHLSANAQAKCGDTLDMFTPRDQTEGTEEHVLQTETDGMELEEFAGAANPMSSQHELAMRRAERIRKIAQERAHKSGVMHPTTDEETWKQRMEVPTFQRRKVKLLAPYPSAANNISRFHLGEQHGLSEDNRFLHDNVD